MSDTIIVGNDRSRDERPAWRIGLLILLVSLGAGCSNTELASSWTSKSFNGPKFTSVVVLGVSNKTTSRRVAEDAFVNQLQSHSVRGVAGYTILPSDPEHLTREQVEQAVKQQGAQGAIVARVAKVEKETVDGGGGMSSYSSSGGWAGTYEPGWAGASGGGGTSYEYDVVSVDVKFYDVKSGELIWSGVTRTFDTSNLESSTTYWAKTVVQELIKRGIL